MLPIIAGMPFCLPVRCAAHSQETKILPPDVGAGDEFGISVVSDDRSVVIGSDKDDDAGRIEGGTSMAVRHYGRGPGTTQEPHT